MHWSLCGSYCKNWRKTMIYEQVDKLISYGITAGLIEENDRFYVRNRLLAILKLDSYDETGSICESIDELGQILSSIIDFAVEKGS